MGMHAEIIARSSRPMRPSRRRVRARRQDVTQAFADALAPTAKWPRAGRLASRRHRAMARVPRDTFLRARRYLAEYFERGDNTYRHLFVGEQIKNFYDTALDQTAARTQAQSVCAEQFRRIEQLLRPELTEGAGSCCPVPWQRWSEALSRRQRRLSACCLSATAYSSTSCRSSSANCATVASRYYPITRRRRARRCCVTAPQVQRSQYDLSVLQPIQLRVRTRVRAVGGVAPEPSR